MTEHVQGAVIEAAARAELAKLLEGRDAQMRLASAVADIEIPSGERPHELRAVLDTSDVRGGPLNVPVRVMIDGGLFRTIWTNWDVELWEQCAVPKQTVHAGETIQLDMLETRRIAQRGRIGASLPAGVIAGTVAAHDLSAGQPIVEQQLVRPTLIARGDTLFLEIRRGPVSARIGVTAQQAGKLGERIRVNVIEGARELTATVASRDLVVIDMNSTGTPR
jgi:flagella basal body P-ring formation protein FlgA